MIRDEGMIFASRGALDRGNFKTQEQIEAMETAGEIGRSPIGPLKANERRVESKFNKEEINRTCDFKLGYLFDCMDRYPSKKWLIEATGNYDWAELPESIDAS
ncbi:unnamed protein product [Adineta ricciae]|uniref:Uncharacterized protein n=1 Tax=Adineta ricciae TaxID=249248 RepID=A0A815MXA4_ADIRI|nr:unnamed protein product [Adineta ricciae]CAF1647208.1 unnamed protein product [Adineta ricciae]